MGQLSEERLRKFENISHLYYDWMSVLSDAGIKEVQDLQGQYLLKCPFHEDKRPSFRIRLHEHNYHCFSCNDFGSVVKLMYKLSSQTIPQVTFYEQMLKANPAMQRELGFSSLFVEADSLDEAFNTRRRFSAKEHIGSGMPLSVLCKRLRTSDDSWGNLVYSLTLLQEGESPESIWSRVSKQAEVKKSSAGVKAISLLSLIDSVGQEE